ncbi:EAL domain-containing protein [Halomonas denitrificans]|nr:EAL domain-containing protein [Halomonas denitrificans]
MLGTRTTVISLASLYLAAAATFALLSSQQIHSAISADHATMSDTLNRAVANGDPANQLFDTLRQQVPLRYGFVRNRADATQAVYGQYQEPTHPLAPLLTLYPNELTAETRYQDWDYRVQLDGNHYLKAAEPTLFQPLIIISVVFAITLMLVIWRSLATGRKLRTLRSAIERLPTFEFPSQLDRISGRLGPLVRALQTSAAELKQQVVKAQRSHDLQHPALDPVTGLKTRALFNEEMERPSGVDAMTGHLILLRAGALAELNERLGHSGGDRYLAEVAVLLKQSAMQHPSSEVYRYGATDFLMKLPRLDSDGCKNLMKTLALQLADLAKHQEVDNAGAVGAIAYQQGDRISRLLTNLDTAVSMAESQGAHEHYLMESSLADLGLDSERWQGVIEDVIEHGRLHFIHQKIRPTREEDRLYTEMLVRFQNEDDHPLPTEPTFGMAARYGLAVELDKLVITRLLRELDHEQNSKEAYGINLANHSFSDPSFMSWLEHRLQDQPLLANRLVFEISERSIQHNATQATHCIERLHRLGARICIDHFGTALTSFRFFQMLKPDYIKLEPELTRDIEKNANNRFFIKMLLDIAVRLEVKVIATHVERSDEKVALEELRVHGLQGHHIALPKPLHHVRA